jgi:hypothetical protein
MQIWRYNGSARRERESGAYAILRRGGRKKGSHGKSRSCEMGLLPKATDGIPNPNSHFNNYLKASHTIRKNHSVKANLIGL